MNKFALCLQNEFRTRVFDTEFASPQSASKILHKRLQNISPWAIVAMETGSKTSKQTKTLCIQRVSPSECHWKGTCAF